ncbi:hypothetical protein M0R45_007838 [Rubus argutus]|uniref:Alpha/beta hydrolase fold-3 domain-containing protein n=1 Tax=Rubus argutus TaxID=59490 RepID=A0AAW1Y0C3_RUBAR
MSDELAHDLSPVIKVYKDGRVERLLGMSTVPASIDPQTGVQSKDLVISNEPLISARLFIPKSTTAESTQKLPLLVYFHGGGFCMESAFSPTYHNYLNGLVSEANVVAVSVDYRRAPEHPLPAAYEDSWAALKWVGSHVGGTGPEEWLNWYADLNRVIFSGDSAGANIAHNMGLRIGPRNWRVFKLAGLFCGSDDPIFNPVKDPKLGELGCGKVLVCVAEKDRLKDRGWYYSESLKKSGWNGVVEVWETKEEQHVFHLYNPNCENAVALRNKIVSFMN